MMFVSSIKKWLFYLLVLSLPFGARIVLIQGGSEFDSFFLYGTDLLLLGIAFLFLWREKEGNAEGKSAWAIPLVLFLFVIFISGFFALDIKLAFLHFLEIVILAVLFLYVRRGVFNKEVFLNILVIILIFQSVLAIGQFALQSDLGLQILGEAKLSPLKAGVAKIETGNLKLIRAYGTFPHPNVLAAFLIFSLFFLIPRLKDGCARSVFLPFGLGVAALFLTFSRAAIAVGLMAILLYLVRLFWRDKEVFGKGAVFVVLLLAVMTLSLFPVLTERFSFKDEAIGTRLDSQNASLQILRENYFLGVGPGNFTSALGDIYQDRPAWTAQPVHNIFLLAGTELGIFGVLFFVWFLAALIWRNIKKPEAVLILAFILLALTDHYFWTFQQGQILWWLGLGLLVTGISFPRGSDSRGID